MEKLKEIDFHITDVCNGHCPMCYATEEGIERKNGDIELLKKVVHNAIVNGEVERFVMVGGDPCEHPHLMELLRYIKDDGKANNVKTTTIVLSNTHDYKEDGKTVSMEEVAKYVDEMDVTVHGATPEIHDAFNGVKGSYEHVMNNIKEYAKVKSEEQAICAVINVMPHTINNMERIMLNTALELDGQLDSFVIQRIAPSGRASGNQFFIQPLDVNKVMEVFKRLKDENGFNYEFCDVFPYCSIKPEYRDMLPKGGCNWGTEVCAVFSDGSVKRCAMGSSELTNMADLDTPEKFQEFWNNNPELQAYRKKYHLDEKCQRCEMLDDCGGACTMSRFYGDPYAKKNLDKNGRPRTGHDVLAME